MYQHYQNSELVFKTRWITNEGFYFSEKELPDTSLEQFLSKSGDPEEHIIFIPYSQIKQVAPLYENQPPLLDMDVVDPSNYQALVADFENKAQLQEAIQEIEKHSGLKEDVEIIKNKSWMRNLLYTIAAAFFGFSLVMMAREMEAGESLDLSGRRSGFKNILASIAGQLGVVGSSVLAIALVAGFGYLTYTIYKSSNTTRVVWKK
ncbi:hypothetical protein [Sphingobacterium faecium]|uniref:hypothetical protein n=1 Tax=Sphingobacterium faecium TaxID=34087 RepID=UPI00320A18F9